MGCAGEGGSLSLTLHEEPEHCGCDVERSRGVQGQATVGVLCLHWGFRHKEHRALEPQLLSSPQPAFKCQHANKHDALFKSHRA